MEENTKEIIREILDNLLNYQEKELNEKEIFELSKMKNKLKQIKSEINLKLNSNAFDENTDEYIIRELKGNLTRIELALENISYIIVESVIVIGSNEKMDGIDEIEQTDVLDGYCEFENENKVDESITQKIENRKSISDPLEAFFISYSSANELIKKIKDELKENKTN